MSHERVMIFIPEGQKVELRDHLTEIKFAGTWDDWMYDKFKNVVLSNKAGLMSGKVQVVGGGTLNITEKDIEKISVKHNKSFKGTGEKTTFTFGPQMYGGLEIAYRIQEFIDKKLKNKRHRSFEEFIDGIVSANLNQVLIDNLTSELDKERDEVKKPKEDKKEAKSKEKKKPKSRKR